MSEQTGGTVRPWPDFASVTVQAVAKGAGPVGPRLDNEWVGWRWNWKDQHSDTFPTLRAAQGAAERIFDGITGWTKLRPSAHHTYVAQTGRS